MSSFKITARHNASGELQEIWCIDDYFGRHKYGYIVNMESGSAMNEIEFYEQYTLEEQGK